MPGPSRAPNHPASAAAPPATTASKTACRRRRRALRRMRRPGPGPGRGRARIDPGSRLGNGAASLPGTDRGNGPLRGLPQRCSSRARCGMAGLRTLTEYYGPPLRPWGRQKRARPTGGPGQGIRRRETAARSSGPLSQRTGRGSPGRLHVESESLLWSTGYGPIHPRSAGSESGPLRVDLSIMALLLMTRMLAVTGSGRDAIASSCR